MTSRPLLVIPDDYNDVYDSAPQLAPVRDRCDVRVFTEPHRSLDELVGRMGDAEMIVANRERLPLGAPLFDRLPTLRLIAQTGGGGAHLDVGAATERGILLAGTAGSGDSTVELALGLMLAAMRRIPYGDAELRAGRWSQFVGRELAGKRLGVIGLGRIGGQVARVCTALGMVVSAWGPTLTPERALAAGAEYRSLDDLLAEVDVVSVHLRLVPETHGLLTREKLARLKPSALFVNTARAAIVDEAALAEMLRDGRLWGAALDVFSEEPLPASHPLVGLSNVVLTPHVGWVSEGSYAQFFASIVENLLAYLDGRPIPRLLNPDALARRAARG